MAGRSEGWAIAAKANSHNVSVIDRRPVIPRMN
jgi:hypothetical protein